MLFLYSSWRITVVIHPVVLSPQRHTTLPQNTESNNKMIGKASANLNFSLSNSAWEDFIDYIWHAEVNNKPKLFGRKKSLYINCKINWIQLSAETVWTEQKTVDKLAYRKQLQSTFQTFWRTRLPECKWLLGLVSSKNSFLSWIPGEQDTLDSKPEVS